ncbi:MFS transporter [Planococcus antarcticus]|nr:MFS transporter [Planococcus antarcticus]
MDMTILNWVIYEWTNSPLMLAILNASRLLPVFLFSLPAGILADRFDKRKILIINYFTLFLATLWIAFLLQRGSTIFWLLAVVALRSCLMTIEVSVRNSFLSDLVPKSMLASAVSIQTTIINLARMIGPAIAGMLLVHFSPGILMYGVSGGTFFVMLSLLSIGPSEQKTSEVKKRKSKRPLKETWRYIQQQPKVLSILLIAIAPMVFGFPYTTMLPLFSKELLQMGPDGFGLLLSVSSFGAIVATLLLAVRQPKRPERLLVISAFSFGMGLFFFILVNESYILVLALMFLIGLASQYYRTLSRVILQLNVDERYSGRILSIALMDRGYIPLGALLVGWIGSVWGVVSAGLFMGIGCCLSTVFIALLRKDLWRGQE